MSTASRRSPSVSVSARRPGVSSKGCARLDWLIRLEAAGAQIVSDLAASHPNGHRESLPEAEAFLRRIVAERDKLERLIPPRP